MAAEQSGITGWAIVEPTNHCRLAGRLSEHEVAGETLLRVDTPRADGTMLTHFLGGQAIYRITPVHEKIARMFAENYWELPLTATPPAREEVSARYDAPAESGNGDGLRR